MLPRHKAILFFGILLDLLIVTGIACYLYTSIFIHDSYLRELSLGLANVSHPARTRRIATERNLGLLVGNGNHCDYLVAELRSYEAEMTPRKLREFYKKTTIWNLIDGRQTAVSLGFVKNGRLVTDDGWEGRDEMLEQSLQEHIPSPLKRQKVYFVFWFDAGYDGGLDPRCW